MNKIKLCCILIVISFMALDLVYAANPSTTTISVTIPALVQISGLSDIFLSPTNFATTVTGSTSACIYTNVLSPSGSYYVTATSLNASSGAFRVTNGTAFVTYDASWNSTSLSSGVKTTQQSGGSNTSLTCGGTPNANFNISLTAAEVEGIAAATYTDTVTLVVSPS